MDLFAANPQHFINQFTDSLLQSFSALCKRHAGKRIAISSIYQEYISDRSHVHLSSTRFSNLKELANHLAETGVCEMEEDHQGIFIVWNEAVPVKMHREREFKSSREIELDDVEAQIKRAGATEEVCRSLNLINRRRRWLTC